MKLLSFLILSTLPFIASAAEEPAKPTKTVDPAPCFQDPSSPACAEFTYPEDLANEDMADLCSSMPYMLGCSVRNTCPNESLDPFCHPVSTLADVCVADGTMSKMRGCKNYNALCKNEKSVVAQCKKEAHMPAIPSTMRVWEQTKSVCNEMDMDGCETCGIRSNPPSKYPTSECDLLTVYSRLCLAMPDMYQCAEWTAMCATIPNSPYCDVSGSSSNPPAMKMYFHGGITDYILFETWVPRTNMAYALSCIAVFVMGFALEGVKIAGLHLEHRWIMADALRHAEKTPYSFGILFMQDIPRVIVTFLSQSLSYMVMLITMVYNYGIFVCTVFGIAVGAGVLRRYLPMPNTKNGSRITCQEECC